MENLNGPEGEKEEEEGGASSKDRPPELHLRKGAIGRGHRRIGGENLRAIKSCDFPSSAPSPTAGTSVSIGKRMMLLSNEARREIAKQVRAMKENRRGALDARHKYLISRLSDA
ncbi:hypothetical protein INR49_025725, partial [Caranx melampygus]